MRKIEILDCTLRDGGYVNEWLFGKNNIKNIIKKLNESNIDIIECGFLRDDIDDLIEDASIYHDFEDLIGLNKKLFESNRTYALMMLCEKCDVQKLAEKEQNSAHMIRLSFHKCDIKKAMKDAKVIKNKGYKLFLQPTATKRYRDEEILELIKLCNQIEPDGVAIVDTFGEMIADDIIHYSRLFDLNLDKKITLAFHAHNNIQTAYSNALLFIQNTSNYRNIVIDSSIYGMGRGAGNLCSELIIDYLNHNYQTNYSLYPILEVADNILTDIRKKHFWGYSIEYYLSAIYHCHPNYCIYFSSKKTLSVKDLCLLVESISEDKKTNFDKEYAEELYFSHFDNNISDTNSFNKLKTIIGNKKIFLLGPGNSLNKEKNKIIALLNDKDNYFSISVNNSVDFDVDACFISNRKRYNDMKFDKKLFYLLTSNIDYNKMNDNRQLVFDYKDCLAKEYEISDNSLLMLLNILKKIGKLEIVLAGFDGYDYEQDKNYYCDTLLFLMDKNRVDELNDLLKKYIRLYNKELNICFLTKSKYEDGR